MIVLYSSYLSHIKTAKLLCFPKLLEFYVVYTSFMHCYIAISNYVLYISFRIVKKCDGIQQNGSHFCNQDVLIIQNQ